MSRPPGIIDQHIDAVFDLQVLVELVFQGLEDARHATRVTETFRKVATAVGAKDGLGDPAVYEETLKRAGKFEAFAENQQTLGFPYVYSLAATRLWSILEAAVTDAVLYAMREPDRLPDDSPLLKIKGPLFQFAQADEFERSETLLELLKSLVRSRLHRGVGRLEVLLEAVGLSGGIEDIVRRTLLELCEIRNIVVHRNGRADKRLIRACPWLALEEDEAVLFKVDSFHLWKFASVWYLLGLDQRLRIVEGHDDPENEETRRILTDGLTEAWARRGAAISATGDQALKP